ncbi:hypothetical protein E2C01_091660 [Portunus trituberculatus]|uniref:Uncharacterized protein n=1 Tax=Portunus trituberculatus TaxID=210409 RepID=A0A5B7JJL6_PORTR|nr:hypothetical protein [Portunus trituberculatus]
MQYRVCCEGGKIRRERQLGRCSGREESGVRLGLFTQSMGNLLLLLDKIDAIVEDIAYSDGDGDGVVVWAVEAAWRRVMVAEERTYLSGEYVWLHTYWLKLHLYTYVWCSFLYLDSVVAFTITLSCTYDSSADQGVPTIFNYLWLTLHFQLDHFRKLL